jgi:hypothetical protein
MDTKYVELRNKLDWTRTQSSKEVRRIQSEANKLRVKWMMVAGSDTTLSALGINGGDEIPEVGQIEGDQRMRTAGKQRRGQHGNGDLPPVATGGRGGKQQVLTFEAPDILQDGEDPAVDKDSPWGSDAKLNELSTSLGRR